MHTTVKDHLEIFLADQRARHPFGTGAPRFVEKELRAFLRCGVLAHGFARFRCEGCGAERLVAFSCKGRGVCPSCAGRRMTARAADLVDRVLPHVRHRQWVLSLPFWLRWRCAWDHALTRAVLALFLRAVFGYQRRRAIERRVAGAHQARGGSVSVIQRFGGALNLNVHFHRLLPDGVWTPGADGAPVFVPLPPPTDEDRDTLCELIERRVKRLLVRRGLWLDDDEGGHPADVDDPPPLASLYEASLAGPGPRRIGTTMRLEPGTQTGLERRTRGAVDLHAGVVVRAGDRERLEHLCRYLLRPAISSQRLERLDGGDLLLRLKSRWSDGTTHLRLSPAQLLGRLAALVPRPRANLILYHGFFAPNAKWRSRVVSKPKPTAAPVWFHQGSLDTRSTVSSMQCPILEAADRGVDTNTCYYVDVEHGPLAGAAAPWHADWVTAVAAGGAAPACPDATPFPAGSPEACGLMSDTDGGSRSTPGARGIPELERRDGSYHRAVMRPILPAFVGGEPRVRGARGPRGAGPPRSCSAPVARTPSPATTRAASSGPTSGASSGPRRSSPDACYVAEEADFVNAPAQFFRNTLTRYRKRQRIVGSVLLVVCALGTWPMMTSSDVMHNRASFLLAIVAFGIAVHLALSFRPSRFIATLERPREIVWVYGRSQGGAVHSVSIGLQTGKLLRLRLAAPSDANEAMKQLQLVAPWATAGWDEATRQRFARDPESLRRTA